MGQKIYANVMMIGRAGAGKSSFLNYLLDIDEIPTGKGEPVTQGFNKYEFENVNGLPLRVYDSKGLEVEDLVHIKSDIINYIKASCGNSDPTQWLHSIFYCVNVKSARFHDEEIRFINEICSVISQTVHIILTHCDTPASDSVIEIENYIKSVIPCKNIKVIKVNSVETRKRNGISIDRFGRDDALDTIFNVLWSDIAMRVSNEYASELHNSLEKYASIMRSTFDSVVSRMTTVAVIKEMINEGGFDSILDSASSKFDQEIDEEQERLSRKYTVIINQLVEFCNEYSDGLGYRISFFKYNDFIPDKCLEKLDNIDIDYILDHTSMGRIIRELDDIDDSGFFGVLKMTGKMVNMLVRIQSLFKEVINDIMWEFDKALPAKDEIADEMYDMLMKQVV